jgi:hypothetical protein
MSRWLRELWARARAFGRAPATPAQGFGLGFGALLVRLLVVAWAGGRFPPADDGRYYQVFAERLASGQGYTWLWPDGVVTPAAHYPVGYPGLLAGLYWAFGSQPTIAMLANALIGALGVVGVHRIARSVTSAGPAALAALVAALHPSLVGYTPALMTEGVTAALLAILGAVAVELSERRRPWLGWLGLGIGTGFLLLVRPQTLLLAPVFGVLSRARAGARAKLTAACGVTALALCVCLPWTLRNCVQMDRCVLVSANMGWNLLIGSAAGATGSFVPLEQLGVPEECREIYGEADKDRCFGRAGVRNVLEHPGRYLALVPAKLQATFDWSGAPGYYLHTSNSAAFSSERKLALGVAEAIVQRLLVLACVIGLARSAGPRRKLRFWIGALAAALLCFKTAWIAHLLLVVQAAALGRGLFRRPDAALAASAVAATALIHAAFFGAGRYGLVCVPLLVALSAAVLGTPGPLRSSEPEGDRKGEAGF